MIRKLLVANRGEIAVRVIRAAREMGIRCVAVYSEADANALHTHFADESVCLGPAEASQSYLRIDRILEAAKQTRVDAIHPGYGFLSERVEFAKACEAAGICFVGPPSVAMRQLGSKIEAKQLAVAAGVPVTPGYFEPDASCGELKVAASRIGYPVMLKASAGGGGRGMRIVTQADAFEDAYRLASEEALKSFGDGAMMVEKLIERPRHIEVQILADALGNVACLFERECSLQRRHQKVLEEAPSPIMSDGLWDRMRTCTESLAKRAGYVGAGTAEYMLDPETGEFYFLEVNARLQVEHPITELIAGVDLVGWQLRIAQGLPLGSDLLRLSRDRTLARGHAIEVRIVAEDPAQEFLPSVGEILAWAEPRGPGLRVDTGYELGSQVSRFYDSLLAKVIAHAPTREEAIAKLRMGLLDFHVLGVKTNIAYLLDVLNHPDFQAGKVDTAFLGTEFAQWGARAPDPVVGIIADHVRSPNVEPESAGNAWTSADDFRNVT